MELLEKANQNYNEVPLHTGQMALIKKSTSNKHWRGDGERGIFLNCWWECKFAHPLRKTLWRFLRKLK